MPIRPPEFVTFTGVDDRTDLDRLVSLSNAYPVEWGVLHSMTKQGKDNRFPSLTRTYDVVEVAEKPGVCFSAHLCGGHARQVLNTRTCSISLSSYSRLQVNYVPNPMWFPSLNREFYPQLGIDSVTEFSLRIGVPAIVQWRKKTFPEDGPCSYLYDMSGGRGEETVSWPRIRDGDNRKNLVGFAGGLGPDNIRQKLAEIDCQAPYWIDMEGRVRTDDWLDLDKCESVLQQIYGG